MTAAANNLDYMSTERSTFQPCDDVTYGLNHSNAILQNREYNNKDEFPSEKIIMVITSGDVAALLSQADLMT
ncbi:hypothetical protein TSAR_016427 [Trichomalopsis sarcophagae]|uniref:Uncharacterized protein n=1 Tax=Trichomalopsis sarcophagae TaxID=543379 RepID=A0A232FJI7_9HYME|nr:hypothetical protein TSAR_016427 [Trichomalopsis sarcophagae]